MLGEGGGLGQESREPTSSSENLSSKNSTFEAAAAMAPGGCRGGGPVPHGSGGQPEGAQKGSGWTERTAGSGHSGGVGGRCLGLGKHRRQNRAKNATVCAAPQVLEGCHPPKLQ